MRTILWAPRFAAVYFLAALALLLLFIALDSNLAIAAPIVLILAGLGVAVLIRNRTVRQ